MDFTPTDLFNPGTVVEMPDGAKYTLRAPTQLEQAQFAAWLEQRIHDATERSNVPAESKIQQHVLINERAAMGYYAWDGPEGLKARWSPDGMAKAIQIILREQDITLARAKEIAVHHINTCTLYILEQAKRDPKALRPLLGAMMGLPLHLLGSESSPRSCASSETHPGTEVGTNSADTATSKSTPSTTASGTAITP